ncbi:MAG: tetratricopeptide repeat protein [Proteobacteria bacterium]|nr:tetratricopeptide repeat protein [Pseudomonadota bacterium]
MTLTKDQIRVLLDGGLAAFRGGKLDKAEELLRQALLHEPRIARAQDMLARVYFLQGRYAEAGPHARHAVALAGGAAPYHETLAQILVAGGEAAAALTAFREAAAASPDDFKTLFGLACLLMAMGRQDEALEFLERARRIQPESVAVRQRIAGCYMATSRYKEALALVNELLTGDGRNAKLHDMAGRALLGLKDPASAVDAYRNALQSDDGAMGYHTGLSAALFRAGRASDAQRATAQFLTRFPSHSRKAVNPEAQVLVLSAQSQACFTKPRTGSNIFANSNTIAQIPADRITFHYMYINHPDPVAVARSLAPVDAIFNNIANAEVAQQYGYTEIVREIVDALGARVINSPEAIARTTRRGNAKTIPENLDIVFPQTVDFNLAAGNLEEIADEIDGKFRFPVLLRRLYSHFDQTVPLAADRAALDLSLRKFHENGVQEIYVIEYRTEPFRPGVFRKMRCALIDGIFYPSFADFSEHWNVHRLDAETAFMKANSELMDEEKAFLEKPADYIGEENIGKLEALARLLDLEFLGVDFNVLRDGELVIFEANSSMRVLQSRLLDVFPYFAGPCETMQDAFERMLLRKDRS